MSVGVTWVEWAPAVAGIVVAGLVAVMPIRLNRRFVVPADDARESPT